MIFTSYTYLVFVAAAFVVYWRLRPQWRKAFLVFASYVFYCSWDWRYGFLLLAVSVFNWWFGRFVLARNASGPWLTAGIAVNLGVLVYFKYAGFIVANGVALARALGADWSDPVLQILLPLGISFFTFQGIAYLVDIASGEEPLERFADFLLFKAFWPQLIAGPIIRLSEIRSQIDEPRGLAYPDVAEGCQRILSGFFKKVVLADNIAPYVDMVFFAHASPNFLDCLTGMIGFGLQIYFDFSGYSDIAIGSARLFGYRFPENFDWPYVSRSPQEFWTRWHMTLSRWIRDYVMTPLTFAYRNRPLLAPLWLITAMALCGLWHGAAWTFVAWGVWHGLLLVLNQAVPSLFAPRAGSAKPVPAWRVVTAATLTFALVQVGWLFFRAQSVPQAGRMLWSLLTVKGGLRPAVVRENTVLFIFVVFAGLIAWQLLRGWREKLQETGTVWGLAWRLARPALYVALVFAIVIFDQEARVFVYFQF